MDTMAPLSSGMLEEYTPGIERLDTVALLHCRREE